MEQPFVPWQTWCSSKFTKREQPFSAIAMTECNVQDVFCQLTMEIGLQQPVGAVHLQAGAAIWPAPSVSVCVRFSSSTCLQELQCDPLHPSVLSWRVPVNQDSEMADSRGVSVATRLHPSLLFVCVPTQRFKICQI